jgi:hypothetical protein
LAQTKAGNECGGTVTAESGQKYCPWHDPRYSAEERRLWALRGSVTGVARRLATDIERTAPELLPEPRPLGTAEDVRRAIELLVQKAESGKLNPSMVTAIKGLIDSAIRLGELQVERDLLDLELEAAKDGRPRGPKVVVR